MHRGADGPAVFLVSGGLFCCAPAHRHRGVLPTIVKRVVHGGAKAALAGICKFTQRRFGRAILEGLRRHAKALYWASVKRGPTCA